MPSKSLRSRARSGQLQCRVRRSGMPRSGREWHAPTTPAQNYAGTTSVGLEPHPAQHYAWHNGPYTEPRPASDHAAQNGQSAQRAFVARRHNGHSAQRACAPHPAQRAWARRSWHNGPSGRAIHRIVSKKECLPRSPDAERFGHQLPRAPQQDQAE